MADSRAKRGQGAGRVLPALCNVLGTLLIAVAFALCALLAVPAFTDFEVLEVASGSMEPSIPVGSAVFVAPVDPADVQVGDVVVYGNAQSGASVAHRVTVNRPSLGELVTKGDANDSEDVEPVPYGSVGGRVEASVPMLGVFLGICATGLGKAYLVLTLACGVMLNVLASRIRQSRRAQAVGEGIGAPPDGQRVAEGMRPQRRRAGAGAGVAAIAAVAAVVFLGSGGVVGYALTQYGAADATYGDASAAYTDAGSAPIAVDFDALRAQNPDVVGWLYCEGTPIDYPVLQGDDNERYLHVDYTGEQSVNGSIFVDCDNSAGFADANTIVYGHHMNSGAMFATLDNWADQAYYDEHPDMWLLTPEADYRVALFSGHHTSAGSSMYEIIREAGARLDALVAEAKGQSDFVADVQAGPDARYVLLSTCDYQYEGDRYVLHGALIPVRR